MTKAVNNYHSEKKNKKKGKKAQALEIIAESNRKITDWTRSGAESIHCVEVGRGVDTPTSLVRNVELLMVEWKPDMVTDEDVLCERGGVTKMYHHPPW